jgi:hypothetical protein
MVQMDRAAGTKGQCTMSLAPSPSVTYKPRVKAGLSPSIVAVEPQSRAGVFYTVNTRGHRCSCPGWPEEPSPAP